MKGWLTSVDYSDVEVGTVESFQGKEKRVILVSTVRANCRLLDYDAKYSLGFLAEDKVNIHYKTYVFVFIFISICTNHTCTMYIR